MKWNEKSQSSHDPCSAASSWRLKHLETGFHSYSYNIHLFKTQWFFHPANHSIRWLVTRGLRWLQDIAKTGRLFLSTDWAASHLLLGEPDINLWRTAGTTYDIHHDVDGAWVAPMHMASKCWAGSMDASWPSIWYGLFNGCQHMSTSIYFSSFCLLFFSVLRHLQPAVQLLFVSQLARQLAKQLDCERGCCQPPVFEASVPLSDSQREKLPVPEKLKSLWLCVSNLPCWECKVFNAWSNLWKSMELRKFGIFR